MNIVAILGHERTGTHLLGTCIGSHPDVRYLDEITTLARSQYLRDNTRTLEQLHDFLERKLARYNEPVLLLDCKLGHIDLIAPLGEFLAERKVIGITREDDEAWMYSWGHAQMRKDLSLAEYGDTPKAEAKPDHEMPTVILTASAQDWIEERRACEKRHWHLGDMWFTYEALTENQNVDQLPEWAAQQICSFLGLEVLPLTTTMVKMSPANLEGLLVYEEGK